jgi:hypothetical protein
MRVLMKPYRIQAAEAGDDLQYGTILKSYQMREKPSASVVDQNWHIIKVLEYHI